ncbi:MAG: phage protease, partial [Gammaproteobacteria bacterium]|nr:phage protease [Gammaproteobacteria bacterium]
LNHSSYDPEQEEPAVDKAIREALGLDAEADAAAAVTAINSMKSARGTPSLDKFVPRADYDAALNRASAAEHTLAERDEAQLKDEIETAINAALEAGKITPATADYHRAQCAFEGGLERFTAFVKAAPELAGASGLEGKRPDEGSALNAEDKRVAAIFGNSPDDIQKYGQEAA